MSSKTDALYKQILQKKVVSFDEIVKLSRKVLNQQYEKSYISNTYVHKLVKDGRLKRIRRGLYVALSPLENEPTVNKILIASKIRKKYYLGFHTALEYYGCAYSHYNETYTCVKPKKRFNSFEFNQYKFTPIFVDDVELEVTKREYQGHKIQVSSKERTFIECLDRVEYAGGWEEALKSLENLGGLNFSKVQNLVLKKGKQMLLRKTGLVLELMRKKSLFYEHLPSQILETLEGQILGQPRYLIRNISGTLNSRWKLYMPEGFEEKLRGV